MGSWSTWPPSSSLQYAKVAETEVEQQTTANRFEAQLRDNQTEETVQGALGAPTFWEPAHSISA
ncbi:hypothetical protein ABZ646_31460, partial [Streptomyces sp. NPDC007162]|uniref:hypothetical protein n=1 Tax=Streptomyces sp. NPDC007162 TaxID=3156917 RepID=UPI0033C18253